MFVKVKNFITEVVVELQKANWSTRQEVIETTKVVLVASAILGIYIAACDLVLSNFVGMVVK